MSPVAVSIGARRTVGGSHAAMMCVWGEGKGFRVTGCSVKVIKHELYNASVVGSRRRCGLQALERDP